MKQVVTILLFSSSLLCFGQDTSSVLNLQQCIAIALKNNPDVARKTIATESSRIDLQQERANLLPSVNAGIGYGLNLGRSINPITNTYVNDKVSYANPYLSGSLLLFNGLAQQQLIKQYALLYKAGQQDEMQVKNELALNVTVAYLEILTNKELLYLNLQGQQTTLQQLNRIEALNKNGAISPDDFFNLKGQFANDQLSVVNTKNQLMNSRMALVKLLNIPFNNHLELAGINAKDFSFDYEKNVSGIYEAALFNFPAIRANQLREKSASIQIRTQRSRHLPSLYFNSGLSSNYSDNARNLQNEPINYMSQFSNNLSKTFSLSLNIPIFNSFSTRNNVSRARLQQRETQLIAQSTRVQLQQLIEQAYFNMNSAKERCLHLQTQADAYQESFRVAEVRFNAGAINTIDYLISKNKLDRAKLDLLTARYDFIIRKKMLDYYQGSLADL